MLLTGKAKTDFEIWYFKSYCYSNIEFTKLLPHQYIEVFGWLHRQKPTIQNSIVIEWFDSVDIIIEIRYLEIHKTFYSFVHGRGIDFSEEHKSNRTEATKQAIIKANELYNNR